MHVYKLEQRRPRKRTSKCWNND